MKHALPIAAVTLAATMLFQAAAQAQPVPATQSPAAQPASVTGVELKGNAPVNPETLRVRLPRPQETTLANGMRVALLEDHKIPTFTLQMIVGGGGLADPADKRGLAMVTAALLREGTKTRSSREIAEKLAELGASFGASASPSSGESTVQLTGLIENSDAALDLFADMVRNAAFPPPEVEKYKSRFLAQLQQQRTQPNFVAQEQFMRAIYGNHPGSHVVPPESVLRELSSAELTDYHKRLYRPNNLTVIAYGDLTLRELSAKLERVFGTWEKAEARVSAPPPPAPPAKSRVMLIDRPGSVQTSIWLGSMGIERNSADYFAVLVMNHVLGGGPASRLFINLREDKGYTYGVYSSFNGSTFPGVMVATTDVRTAVTEGALQELTAELERIASEPVPEKELAHAKRALIGRFALSLDSPQALIANVATQKIYGLPDDYWDKYPQHVAAISAADIQRVARKYFDRSRLQLVAVGDSSAVRKTLEKYGSVETVAP